jgi:hypothetical protein
MIETAIILVILGLMLFLSVVLSGLLVKRATHQVIDRFCTFEALDIKKARNAQEHGRAPPDLFQRMFRPRDYKPYALQALGRGGFIRMTRDGKLYLVEEKLRDDLKCKQAQ